MRRLFGTAAALALIASPALAQEASALRQGFTVSFGIGAGSAAFTNAGTTSKRAAGPSGYLRLGGALTPTLVLAGETHGWTRTDGTLTSHVGYLMAVTQWYPQAAGGFHLLGGLGFGMLVETETDPTLEYDLESYGGALQLGLGYDVRMTRNFSLTPYVNALGMAGGKSKFNGAALGSSYSANVIQFGLGFSWH